MIITCHLLAGVAVATKIKIAPLAFILAFLSHYFLDFIPHREYVAFPKYPLGEKWGMSSINFLKIVIDFLIGISILLILSENKILALLGGFFAILPDSDSVALIFPSFLKNRFFKIHFDFHLRLHFFENKKISLFWRIFSQVLVGLISIYFLL